MLYCFDEKNEFNSKKGYEINEAIKNDSFIYFDKVSNTFKDQFDRNVSVNNRNVKLRSDISNLNSTLNKLIIDGAKVDNNIDDLKEIIDWYIYREPDFKILPFSSSDLNDLSFQTYLLELFSKNEIILKSKNSDFSIYTTILDILDSKSPVNNYIYENSDSTFIITEVLNIKRDQLGEIKYRAVVTDNVLMNISRHTHSDKHNIPTEVALFISKFINNNKDNYNTYVFDIALIDEEYQVIDVLPIETAEMYLYNSVMNYSSDLLHNDINNIPAEAEELLKDNEYKRKLI